MGIPGLGVYLGLLCTLAECPPSCYLSSFWPVDFLRNFFSQTLGLGTQKERLLDDLTLEGVARYMLSERCKSLSSSPIPEPLPSFLAPSDFSAPAT